MSHFYGTIRGQAGQATRRGSKSSGLTTEAASWNGVVRVTLDHRNEKDSASNNSRGDTAMILFVLLFIAAYLGLVFILPGLNLAKQPLGAILGAFSLESPPIGEVLVRRLADHHMRLGLI